MLVVGGENSRVLVDKDQVVQDTKYKCADYAALCVAKVQGAESVRNGATHGRRCRDSTNLCQHTSMVLFEPV